VKAATLSTVGGKLFDVKELWTDVLQWQTGGWKSVVTHETKIKE
jgi:hypothetical protein